MNTNLRGPFLMTRATAPQTAGPSSRCKDLGRPRVGAHGEHRLSCIESWPHPSHPLLGGGTRALDHGQLHRARSDRGHTDVRRCSTRPSCRGEGPGSAKAYNQPRGRCAASRSLLSIGLGHRSNTGHRLRGSLSLIALGCRPASVCSRYANGRAADAGTLAGMLEAKVCGGSTALICQRHV